MAGLAYGTAATALLPPEIALSVHHPDSLSFSVAITNSETAPLTFRRCSYDCPCLFLTNAALNGARVAPGTITLQPADVLRLDFFYDGRYYSAPKILPLYFYFQGVVPAAQVLRLRLRIESAVVPFPELPAYVVPQGYIGALDAIKLAFSNTAAKIGAVRVSLPELTARYDEATRAITVAAARPLSQSTNAWIVASLAGVAQKELHIRIKEIKVIPDLYPSPSLLDFGIVAKTGTLVGKEVNILSRTERPWKVTGVRLEGKAAKLAQFKLLPQTNAAVNTVWAILEGKLYVGMLHGTLVVTTDHPFSKEVRIPVRAQIIKPTAGIKQ